MSDRQDLNTLGQELLSEAAQSAHGRASRAVIHGDRQRAVLMAYAGSGLGEHDAPPAATPQVLRGRASVVAGDDQWELSAGELVTIPQERHRVDVPDEATVLLLTVAVD